MTTTARIDGLVAIHEEAIARLEQARQEVWEAAANVAGARSAQYRAWLAANPA